MQRMHVVDLSSGETGNPETHPSKLSPDRPGELGERVKENIVYDSPSKPKA